MTKTGRNSENRAETEKSEKTAEGGGRMQSVGTRVPEELKRRVKEEADERGVPVAQVLREATQEHLRGSASEEGEASEEARPSDVIEASGGVVEVDEDETGVEEIDSEGVGDAEDDEDVIDEEAGGEENEKEGSEVEKDGASTAVLLLVVGFIVAMLRDEETGVTGR